MKAMTQFMKSLFAFFLINLGACAQEGDTGGNLVGQWMNTDTNGGAIECPDLLIFDSNGNYSIVNDCYGIEPRNPVTESGKWIFISSESLLRLNDRVFVTNHSLMEPTKELRIRVEKLSPSTLTLTFGEKATQPERYRKVRKASESSSE